MYRSLRDCINSSTHAHLFFPLFDEILYKIFFKKIKEVGKLYFTMCACIIMCALKRQEDGEGS